MHLLSCNSNKCLIITARSNIWVMAAKNVITKDDVLIKQIQHVLQEIYYEQ